MDKRIIFVGIHNKTNKTALDSSTKAGKIIDKIINQLNCDCVKTNLFNLNHIPKYKEPYLAEWFWTHLPTDDDIAVLLGKKVQKYFDFDCRVIKIDHPSKPMDTKKYISDTIDKINKTLNE